MTSFLNKIGNYLIDLHYQMTHVTSVNSFGYHMANLVAFGTWLILCSLIFVIINDLGNDIGTKIYENQHRND